MSLKSPRTWILGGALLALVLAALGWQLVVSPQRQAAVAAQDQVSAARTAEETQRVRLQQLSADFAQLPTHRAELATARQSVPVSLDLPALTRRLTSTAAGAGLTLMSVAPADAVSSGVATTPSSATAPVDGADAGTTAAGDASAASAAAVASTSASLQAVPLRVTVIGPFDGATRFLRGLQTDDAPSLLVTGVAVNLQDPADASGGKPTTVNGDVELVIDARAFVLPSQNA